MKEIAGTLSAAGMKFGIAVSRFNSLFTEQLLKGAEDCLLRHGAKPGDIAFVRVPGASELPLAVQRLLKSGKFDAVLALGCVIQGATDKPVTGGLVAAASLDQAIERAGTKMGNKGWDAAMAAIEMASVFKQL